MRIILEYISKMHFWITQRNDISQQRETLRQHSMCCLITVIYINIFTICVYIYINKLILKTEQNKEYLPGLWPRDCRNAHSQMVATSEVVWSWNGPSWGFPGQCIVPHCSSYWRGTPGEGSTWDLHWENTAEVQAGFWGLAPPYHIPISWRTAQT